MDIRPSEHPNPVVSRLLNGAVIPRPIAWVSTVDADGLPNLAPFSFFNAVCGKPPTVLFCTDVRANAQPKDTLRNVRATGEFVVNFVTEGLAEAMNATSVEAPPQVNEFERAGLTAVPGQTVQVPHVGETPIYFECKLHEIVTISDEPGGGSIIIGTVSLMHVDDALFQEGGYINRDAYHVIGRTTGRGYVRLSDRFEMQRPPSEL